MFFDRPRRREAALIHGKTEETTCNNMRARYALGVFNSAFTLLATRSATLVREKSRQLGDPLLMPAKESLHFLKGDGAIVVGIHALKMRSGAA
jgi:hypothetical protein